MANMFVLDQHSSGANLLPLFLHANLSLGHASTLNRSVMLFLTWSIRLCMCSSSRFIAVGLFSSWSFSVDDHNPDLVFISDENLPRICLVKVQRRSAGFWFVKPKIPLLPFRSLMMVFSVAISLHCPLNTPTVYLMANLPDMNSSWMSSGRFIISIK